MYRNIKGVNRVPADGNSLGLKRKYRNPLASSTHNEHNDIESNKCNEEEEEDEVEDEGREEEDIHITEEEIEEIALLEAERWAHRDKKQHTESPESPIFESINETLNADEEDIPPEPESLSIDTSSMSTSKKTASIEKVIKKRELPRDKQALKDAHDLILKGVFDKSKYAGIALTNSTMKVRAAKGYKCKSGLLPKVEVVNVSKTQLLLTEAALVNDFVLYLEYNIASTLKTEEQSDEKRLVLYLESIKESTPLYVFMREDTIPSRMKNGMRSNHSMFNFPNPSKINAKWQKEVEIRNLKDMDVGRDFADARKEAIFQSILDKYIKYFKKKTTTSKHPA